PAQLVGRHHLVRLLADRAVRDHPAPPDTRGKATGEDVVLPRAVDPHSYRNHGRAGADGVRPLGAQSALAQPAVLGGGDRAVLRREVPAWTNCRPAAKSLAGP